MQRARIVLAVVASALVAAAPAEATFPGGNGKIAFSSNAALGGANSDIYAINPDGTGATRLTNVPDREEYDPS